MAMSIAFLFMTPFIIKSIITRKDMNTSNLKLTHVLLLIIKSHLLTKMINKWMLIFLLGLPLKNIWSWIKIGVRISLHNFLSLTVISLLFLFVLFKEPCLQELAKEH